MDPKNADPSAPTLLDADSSAATLTPSSLPPRVDPVESPLDERGFGVRYEAKTVLGEGGMGEVRLCRDRRIGRDVAVKIVKAGAGTRSDARARFLREARVQGQLEHPAIVPVYDLGLDTDGRPFFSMKRVRGETLEEILDALERGDASAVERHTRRKLLAAFEKVCLAIDFAHTRGVLHRDLKPGNVMLGEFGEVWVLDWGLAKVVKQAGADSVDAPADAQTLEGAVLGTPGYMAPEQVGTAEAVDARADVYALGAILFEILAAEPLHARGTVQQLIASTLRGADARISVRKPEREVPPELEAICAKATALDPKDRYPTVHAIRAALERYLDGDRDLERRRAMSAEHAVVAAEAASKALAGDDAERGRALREVGKALALDPANVEAMRTLARLLTEPPKKTPAEVDREIESAHRLTHRFAARQGGLAFASWFVYVPVFLWMGIRDWWASAACLVLMALASGVSFTAAVVRDEWLGTFRQVSLWVALLATVAMSRGFGPLVLVPSLAAAITIAYSQVPDPKARLVTIVLGCLSIVVPAAVEWLGWLPRSYAFERGAMTILPQMSELPAGPTFLFLLVGSLACIATPAFLIGRISDSLREAERRVLMSAWQLRRLVPE